MSNDASPATALYVVTSQFEDYETPETPVAVFASKAAAMQALERLNAPSAAHRAQNSSSKKPSQLYYDYKCYGPFEIGKVFAFDTDGDSGWNAANGLMITQ